MNESYQSTRSSLARLCITEHRSPSQCNSKPTTKPQSRLRPLFAYAINAPRNPTSPSTPNIQHGRANSKRRAASRRTIAHAHYKRRASHRDHRRDNDRLNRDTGTYRGTAIRTLEEPATNTAIARNLHSSRPGSAPRCAARTPYRIAAHTHTRARLSTYTSTRVHACACSDRLVAQLPAPPAASAHTTDSARQSNKGVLKSECDAAFAGGDEASGDERAGKTVEVSERVFGEQEQGD